MIKNTSKRLFIFAGEKSGDLHGSHLIEALKHKHPSLFIEGVAGPKMRLHAISGPLTMEDFEVMGFSDVIRALPKLYSHFYKIRDHILATSPDVTLLIDYPGFNMRLAKALRQKGYRGKIVQYISPTVWAWGKHRIDELVKTLDLLLTIYPFEASYFTHTKLNVAYVGNPLTEYLSNYRYDEAWQEKIALPKTEQLIALFPGSRESEIKRNLPVMLEAAAMIKEKHPEALFAISCAHQHTQQFFNEISGKLPSQLHSAIFFVPREFTYELMRDSRTAIAKSGTVTLELALHRRPTVVIYMLTWLNRLYAQFVLKLNLPHYCIVNILAKHDVFPELIESGLTAHNLFNHFQTLNDNTPARQACQKTCAELHHILQTNVPTSTHAANILAELLA